MCVTSLQLLQHFNVLYSREMSDTEIKAAKARDLSNRGTVTLHKRHQTRSGIELEEEKGKVSESNRRHKRNDLHR